MNLKQLLYFLGLLFASFSLQPTNFSQELLNQQVQNYTGFLILPFWKWSEEKVFMFGGIKDGTLTNKLYQILLSTQQYDLIQRNNPQSRYQHCGVVSEHLLYVYGGIGENGVVLDDLWVYNSINLSWRSFGNSGLSIQSCSLLYRDGQIYVFGNNKTTLGSINIKYSFSSDEWSDPGFSFIQVEQLKGVSYDLQQVVTEIDIGYVSDINSSNVLGSTSSNTTQSSSVCTVTNGDYHFFITQKSIYSLDFSEWKIQIVKRTKSDNENFKCLISAQWLFIIYLNENTIHIVYHCIGNLQIQSQFFNVGGLDNINSFESFIDSQENIHFILGQNITSWVLNKDCPDQTENITSCFYSNIICASGYRGSKCQTPICPNSLILYDELSFSVIKFQCSNHGTCTENGCECDQYWSGQDCSNYQRISCEGQVIANWPVVNCQCTDVTAGGNYCEVTFCYNDCSGKGTCGSNGQCICNSGYAGPDCSITIIEFI